MTIHDLEFITSAAKWEHLPEDGTPEVAFVGRSNVGKSSLLNMLVGRRNLARTSGQPGKTRTFNYFRVNDQFYLVDLPGYGYAKVSRTERERWGRFIGRFLDERLPLRLVIHLVDSRHPPTALDRDVMGFMRGGRVPYLIALTKADKLSNNKRQQSVAQVRKTLKELAMEVPIVLTSAEKKEGRDEVLQWIEDMVVFGA